jgi:hypothetical protein
MPYVPPHLRPGYVPPAPVAPPDFSGKVHWPTNVNSFKETNIVQPSKMHSPQKTKSPRTTTKKSVLKQVAPIEMNMEPPARPGSVRASKFHNAVKQHLKRTMKKKQRVRKPKASKKVRRRKQKRAAK